jgi:hypothetical protein
VEATRQDSEEEAAGSADLATDLGERQMMRLLYRFMNARSVQRLYSQQDFEMMFGADVMRRGRAKIALKLSRPHRESGS